MLNQRRPRPPPALHICQAGLPHLRGGGTRGVPQPPGEEALPRAQSPAEDARQTAVPEKVHLLRPQDRHVALLFGIGAVCPADVEGERPGRLFSLVLVTNVTP